MCGGGGRGGACATKHTFEIWSADRVDGRQGLPSKRARWLAGSGPGQWAQGASDAALRRRCRPWPRRWPPGHAGCRWLCLACAAVVSRAAPERKERTDAPPGGPSLWLERGRPLLELSPQWPRRPGPASQTRACRLHTVLRCAELRFTCTHLRFVPKHVLLYQLRAISSGL